MSPLQFATAAIDTAGRLNGKGDLQLMRLDGPMLTPPKQTLSILLMSKSAPCDLAKAS
jgi:hypothetical protein